METKHTPGPWTLQGEPESIRVEGPRNRNSRSHLILVERVGGRRYGADYSDLSELVANAKLIAAAPDLLKALERIARPHDCGCVPCTGSCISQEALQITVDNIRDLAKAAIAKVTA